MESKVSKAQEEVWEWKDSLFEELKNIPKKDRLKFIREKVKRQLNKLDFLLKNPTLPNLVGGSASKAGIECSDEILNLLDTIQHLILMPGTKM